MGAITVSVHYALGWPFRPERTQILLDGVPIHDGTPVPSIDPLHTVEIVADASVPCGALAAPRAVRRAECRAAAAVEQSRKNRDVVAAMCRDAKLTEIRETLPRAEAGDSVAASTVFRLEREAVACIGQNLAVVNQPSITELTSCPLELPNDETPR